MINILKLFSKLTTSEKTLSLIMSYLRPQPSAELVFGVFFSKTISPPCSLLNSEPTSTYRLFKRKLKFYFFIIQSRLSSLCFNHSFQHNLGTSFSHWNTKQKGKLPLLSLEFCQSPQNIKLIIFSSIFEIRNVLFPYGTQIRPFEYSPTVLHFK